MILNDLHKLHLRITRPKNYIKRIKNIYCKLKLIHMTIWTKFKKNRKIQNIGEHHAPGFQVEKLRYQLDVSKKNFLHLSAPLRNKHSTQLHNSLEGKNNYPQCQRGQIAEYPATEAVRRSHRKWLRRRGKYQVQ